MRTCKFCTPMLLSVSLTPIPLWAQQSTTNQPTSKPQERYDAQPMNRERFLQPFFHAARRTGTHALQLPEQFLQLRFGFRVAGQGVGVRDSSVIIPVHVLGQVRLQHVELLTGRSL